MMMTNKCERFLHRRSSYRELQYISDGDNNGVIYYAGTSFGKHQWINPVLAKNITVTASSPNSRYTDPKALVSKKLPGDLFCWASRRRWQEVFLVDGRHWTGPPAYVQLLHGKAGWLYGIHEVLGSSGIHGW
eukprot:UN05201